MALLRERRIALAGAAGQLEAVSPKQCWHAVMRWSQQMATP